MIIFGRNNFMLADFRAIWPELGAYIAVWTVVSREEYLDFNVRQTKTKTWSDFSYVRTIPQGIFVIGGTERDPVTVYKNVKKYSNIFAMKRPKEIYQDDTPYLSVSSRLTKLKS